MIPRGEVSLVFAQIGLAGGLLTAGLYGAVMVMVIITAFATPLALRALLPPFEIATSDREDRSDTPDRQ